MHSTQLGGHNGSVVKNPPIMQETWVQSLSQEYPLEQEMATNSSILAWKITWTQQPGVLQSLASLELDTTERLKTITHITNSASKNKRYRQNTRRDISPKEANRWLTAREKMLNTATYQRHVNQKRNELSPHTCQNSSH